ncbi:MAG: DUF3109 family protein [Muribaculaceae bacterium]|nr:DUF3109 family protein [Muribaculaceae bacterium]
MFVIKDTLVSLDLIEKYFVCDLSVCKGQCCIDGDAGAPLLEEEKTGLEINKEKILPLLSPGGRRIVEEEGVSYYDSEGDLVTTLIEGCNCVFSIYSEDGVCMCALEKGYREGKLPNLKPSSCFLYPVRLSKVGSMTALNLHRWKICRCAEKKGRELGIRAYEFLKEPLIRKFGKDWWEELDTVAKEWQKGAIKEKNDKK